jgi:hypothetical protein
VELKEREDKMEQWEQKMKLNAEKAKQKIVLDVGGKRFAASKLTLLTFSDSYFWAMLSTGTWQPDEDGIIQNL